MNSVQVFHALDALGAVIQAYGRIEGMKVANAERERNGYAMAYGPEKFFEEADGANQTVQNAIGRIRDNS